MFVSFPQAHRARAPSVGRDGPAPQTSTREVLHGGHADVHERAQVEEHVVEGVDGQASGFVGVLQSDDGRVHGVGQVTEARPAGFNHFLGALQEEGGRGRKDTGFIYRVTAQ